MNVENGDHEAPTKKSRVSPEDRTTIIRLIDELGEKQSAERAAQKKKTRKKMRLVIGSKRPANQKMTK